MIALDYRDKRPLYEQVKEKLTNLIAAGALPENEKLPSVRALAMELAINPNTVQRAYRELESEGFIYTVQGRGNFVSGSDMWQNSKLREIMHDIRSLFEQALSFGITKSELIALVEQVCDTGRGED